MTFLLDKYWTDLRSKFNLHPEASSRWLDSIRSAYDRDNYYNVRYLNTKLAHFATCYGILHEPFSVFIALVFQSIFYENKTFNNVDKCIDYFVKFAAETGLDQHQKLTETIKALIQQQSIGNVAEDEEENAEADLGSEFKDGDKYYFMDINFCHLASDWPEYMNHSKQTRSEYASMNEEAYTRLRKKVLQNFLLIPNIFSTKLFRQKYEQKARENIQNEISAVLN